MYKCFSKKRFMGNIENIKQCVEINKKFEVNYFLSLKWRQGYLLINGKKVKGKKLEFPYNSNCENSSI